MEFLLSHEPDPLALVPIFKQTHIGEPDEYLVLLLFLVKRNLAIIDILNSGLLQAFCAYHSHDDLQNFYSEVQGIPQLRELIAEASKFSCGITGFGHDLCGGPYRADLSKLTLRQGSCLWSPSVENFQALRELFGDIFLKITLENWHQCQSTERELLLSSVFNQDAALVMRLVEAFVKAMPDDFNMPNDPLKNKLLNILALIARNFSLENIQKLITEGNPWVVYLLIYNPQNLPLLTPGIISSFITEANKLALEDRLLKFNEFFCLLLEYKLDNHALVIYEPLLKDVLNYEGFLKDSILFNLRRFPEGYELCYKLSSQLMHDFCSKTKGLMHDFCSKTKELIAINHRNFQLFSEILRLWISLGTQLKTIEEITTIEYFTPQNRYELQVFILEFLLSLKHPLSLEFLKDFFGIHNERSIHWRKFLLAVSAADKTPGLRNNIFSQLQAAFFTPKRIAKVMPLAIKYDNLTFVQKIFNLGVPVSIDNFFVTRAIVCNSKNMVAFALKHQTFGVQKIKDFIEISIGTDNIEITRILLRKFALYQLQSFVKSLLLSNNLTFSDSMLRYLLESSLLKKLDLQEIFFQTSACRNGIKILAAMRAVSSCQSFFAKKNLKEAVFFMEPNTEAFNFVCEQYFH